MSNDSSISGAPNIPSSEDARDILSSNHSQSQNSATSSVSTQSQEEGIFPEDEFLLSYQCLAKIIDESRLTWTNVLNGNHLTITHYKNLLTIAVDLYHQCATGYNIMSTGAMKEHGILRALMTNDRELYSKLCPQVEEFDVIFKKYITESRSFWEKMTKDSKKVTATIVAEITETATSTNCITRTSAQECKKRKSQALPYPDKNQRSVVTFPDPRNVLQKNIELIDKLDQPTLSEFEQNILKYLLYFTDTCTGQVVIAPVVLDLQNQDCSAWNKFGKLEQGPFRAEFNKNVFKGFVVNVSALHRLIKFPGKSNNLGKMLMELCGFRTWTHFPSPSRYQSSIIKDKDPWQWKVQAFPLISHFPAARFPFLGAKGKRKTNLRWLWITWTEGHLLFKKLNQVLGPFSKCERFPFTDDMELDCPDRPGTVPKWGKCWNKKQLAFWRQYRYELTGMEGTYHFKQGDFLETRYETRHSKKQRIDIVSVPFFNLPVGTDDDKKDLE